MIKSPKTLLVIFISSFCGLAFEITLTRIFSISLWYHFAFMIVSIAMLGIGASGTVLSIYPRLRNPSHIAAYSLLLGVSITAGYLFANQIPFDPARLSWDTMQLLYVGLYYIALSPPFFFTGLIVATAFTSLSEESGLVYGADLLGAGTGSMAVLCLMTVAAPEQVVFILSAIACLASFTLGRKWLRAASVVLAIGALLLLCLQPPVTRLRMSPYKGLQLALQYPGARHIKTYLSPLSRIDTFRSPAARFAPGLSLRYLDPLPEQTGVSIDGGDTSAITAARDRRRLAFLRFLPSSLPYELGRTDDVLILDPKGGLQVLVARTAGAGGIVNVESNPLLVKVVREDYRDLAGDIYGENTHTGLGRSWLATTARAFDIIDISLMGTAPSGSFGIGEDYRFTVEAFQEYLKHLKANGVLSVNLFLIPPARTELRFLTVIIAALEEMGVREPEKHIAAIRTWGTMTILVRRSPFTGEEIDAAKRFSKERRFDLVYYPGIREEESNVYVRMPQDEYYAAFKNILNLETRERFLRDYLFDVRPVGDDNPFFQYYLKLENIGAIYRIMGEKWQYFVEEGYLLPAVFLQVLLLSLVLIVLPGVAGPGFPTGSGQSPRLFPVLAYFAALGMGFMFVEIVLIQRMILPLEHPSYAVATVLTSLLLSSGLGSLLSQRMGGRRAGLLATPAVAFLVIVYSLLAPVVSQSLSSCSMPVKIALVFLALMPLGMCMGVPFPSGLRVLGAIDNSLIPWAWATNGCLSVLAPMVSVMLAMAVGFRTVLLLGALAYAVAFAALSLFSAPLRRSSAQRSRG